MGRPISAGVVAVLALATAVGAGGIAVAASGPPLTKDQYIAAYNALCDTGITKTQAAVRALGRNHNNDDVAHAIVPIFQHRLDETRKLVPPTADRKRVKALIAAQQDAINKVKDSSDALAGGHIGQSPGETFRQNVGKKADKLAKAYGLESGNCVDTPGPGAGNAGPQGTQACPGGPCAQGNPPAPGGNAPPPPGPSNGGGPGTGGSQWVAAVCVAETTLHGVLQGELDAIRSKPDAASQKQGFVDFLSGLPAQLKTLERAIKKAGADAVTNGKKIAKTYIDTLEAIRKKVPSLKAVAAALPTTSTDALQTAGKAIGQALDAIKRKGDAKVSSLDVSGMLAPDLARCGGIFPL